MTIIGRKPWKSEIIQLTNKQTQIKEENIKNYIFNINSNFLR